MKKLSILGILATAMLLGSCTNDDATTHESEILKGINVTIEQADFFAQSRATYEVDPARGFVSSWSAGDIIGIYPLGGDQVAFPISENEGSATARFDGGSWALRSNVKYSAYYPFSKSNYTVSETEIPISYTGQAQNGNNSTTGLAAYDYLAAAATQPNSNGSVNLTMKHLGAFVRFQLTIPKAATLVKANVASDGTEFVTAGTVDLSATTPAITSKTTASSFDIALSNITCAKDEVVTLYAMVAPVNLSNSKMKVALIDNEDKTYIYECNGVNFAASKSYNFTITETSGGTGATIDNAGWADGQVNGHDYVDLGLSVKWATCNVGASKPEEHGDYFAWGETEPKSDYSWSTYLTSLGGSISTMWDCGKNKDPLAGYVRPNNISIAGTQYDVAHVKWGGNWKMPTKEQQDELRQNCYWCWTSNYNGKSGFIVYKAKSASDRGCYSYNPAPLEGYSTSDAHIFLPITGSSNTYDDSRGIYWSASPEYYYASDAYILRFESTYVDYSGGYRCDGHSVRPVLP